MSDTPLHERFAPVFQRIAQGAVQREQERTLAFDAVDWLKTAGFGALRVPLSQGGLGASLPELFALLIELGSADSNLPQIVRAHFGFVEGRLVSQDPESQAYWFPKVVAGQLWGAAMAERSDTTTNSVTLKPTAEGWQLDGQKYYCTGTLYADWIAVAAADGPDFISVVVPTDAPGVTRVDDWDGFGQRLSGSGSTRFEQVAVPEHQVLRRFKPGELRAESYISAFYQLFHLATLAGIARAALRDAVDFVQGRTRAFGIPGQSSPRLDPLVQRVIGKLSSLSYAADSLVQACAQVLQSTHEAVLDGSISEAQYVDADVRTYQAQQVILPLVLEATSLLFEVGGASATSQVRRLDRHWRNARTLASHNPAIYRERALGDFYLNDVSPAAAWRAAQEQAVADHPEHASARDEASAV
ncbi:acyl-CoA dehydrogenase family protein [Pseudomonas sp. MF6772]|uniref:acyl-CoA dehydrogenase family protein n=1 Tax=Pseudomonas TaxID=286 RepID=UPI0014736EE8|nr:MULTISPECIES: acyl-CoA dehydrogenase family protein [Pseudomonas]MBJ2270757.1 acyl-CoA dehydrogenase family protein [Pseudomonas sp. MF6772]MBL7230430.1 acyl-CoA dehydrogenase family protein [Pseudomonas sp.]MCU0213696.1 acyl-CoA dehydrogenase family protein [Pseudomonas shahriarae]MDD0982188.1 acyl-CoA dehydrogenase family protein [Pseudomonas shahriarae]NMY23194.1 acyl-CoA dehydrogenase family protein [Pseudomonas sp. WS 5410]